MKRRFLPTANAVAEAVRIGRMEKGWTQAQLAVKTKVTRRFILELEEGHLGTDFRKLLEILRALDIHAVELPSIASNVRLEDIDLDEELERFS
ncbi:helix-turn-helix domain-containing protein [Paeniglutamicibacter sp. R2-26]|uniref:helix-turn-helix domain-containing protein n=1 Tax=Paeniglutamicibacter sp. R2-26 TaxID=3144417 RepID=UPI003EE64EB4